MIAPRKTSPNEIKRFGLDPLNELRRDAGNLLVNLNFHLKRLVSTARLLSLHKQRQPGRARTCNPVIRSHQKPREKGGACFESSPRLNG
jgi:hypothetical protein